MQLTNLAQSKKLKEWGAPQDTGQYIYKGKVSGSLVVFPTAPMAMDEGFELVAAAYSLDELIEWLGNNCYRIERDIDKGTWIADGFADDYEIEIEPWYEGRTMLEAVFNLAEAIHSKKGE